MDNKQTTRRNKGSRFESKTVEMPHVTDAQLLEERYRQIEQNREAAFDHGFSK